MGLHAVCKWSHNKILMKLKTEFYFIACNCKLLLLGGGDSSSSSNNSSSSDGGCGSSSTVRAIAAAAYHTIFSCS